MKVCAYCGKSAALTREHIWPDSLIERYKGMLTYSKKEQKLYKGDPTIKDVCAHCNNVILSKLDAYLLSLYDKHFERILQPGEPASLSYDYEMLLRVLLKISYNSSRANASEKTIKTHKAFAPFILNGGYCPPVQIRLQIVTASRAINLNKDTEKLLEPRILRCAEIAYDGQLSHRFSIRMVGINCFWFFLIFPYKAEPHHKWDELTEGLNKWRMNMGIKLSPKNVDIAIPVNQTTYLHSALLSNLLNATQM
jgi:hypothetical protein